MTHRDTAANAFFAATPGADPRAAFDAAWAAAAAGVHGVLDDWNHDGVDEQDRESAADVERGIKYALHALDL